MIDITKYKTYDETDNQISLNIRGICIPMVPRMSNLLIRNCLKIALDNTERLLICRLSITI
ncbi:hypothetical protein T08_12851 [Trichinella sp. T8]|nr:hypothetical protein T08_12851 [Trichinella sp. T8]